MVAPVAKASPSAPRAPKVQDLVVLEYDRRDGLVWAFDQQNNEILGPFNLGGGGGLPYVLPVATATVLGGIRVGPGFRVDPTTGVIEFNFASLPAVP